MSSLISSDAIKARHLLSTKGFIDDLCAINNGGEFGKSFCDTYPKSLNLGLKSRVIILRFEFGHNYQGGDFYI